MRSILLIASVILLTSALLVNAFIIRGFTGYAIYIVNRGLRVFDVVSEYNVGYRVLYLNPQLNTSKLVFLVGDCLTFVKDVESPPIGSKTFGVVNLTVGQRLCQVLLRYGGSVIIWDEAVGVEPGVVAYSWKFGGSEAQVTVEVSFDISSVSIAAPGPLVVKVKWYGRGGVASEVAVDCNPRCNTTLRPPLKATSYDVAIEFSLDHLHSLTLSMLSTAVILTAILALYTINLYVKRDKR